MISSDIHIFIIASLVLLVVPGPAVLYIVARSVEEGTKTGLISVAGIGMATIVHILTTAFGLAVLLKLSPLAFDVLRYAGAAYLTWLGLRQLFHRPKTGKEDEATISDSRKVFWQGFLVNLLNPKAILFFLAFLPQFADPARGNMTLQLLLLGTLFLGMAVLSDAFYALLAGSISDWLRKRPGVFVWQRYLSGGLLVLLGIWAAFGD